MEIKKWVSDHCAQKIIRSITICMCLKCWNFISKNSNDANMINIICLGLRLGIDSTSGIYRNIQSNDCWKDIKFQRLTHLQTAGLYTDVFCAEWFCAQCRNQKSGNTCSKGNLGVLKLQYLFIRKCGLIKLQYLFIRKCGGDKATILVYKEVFWVIELQYLLKRKCGVIKVQYLFIRKCGVIKVQYLFIRKCGDKKNFNTSLKGNVGVINVQYLFIRKCGLINCNTCLKLSVGW